MIDVYAEDKKPIVTEIRTTYRLTIPGVPRNRQGVNVFVMVDKETNQIDFESRIWWFGGNLVMKDVMDWLVEWELAEWHPVGPEDRDLFATEKLTNATA